MLTDKYQKQMVYSEFTAQVLRNVAAMILKKQAANVDRYFNYRTGHTIASLYDNFVVARSGAGATLNFNYLIDLRFLDLKRTALGKKKKLYGPVYSKPLYGYIYGYAFGTIRYGLTETVEANIFETIREFYKIPI